MKRIVPRYLDAIANRNGWSLLDWSSLLRAPSEPIHVPTLLQARSGIVTGSR